MKKIIMSLFGVVAVMMTLTSCEGLREPLYVEGPWGTPAGQGTADDPYNVAAISQIAAELPADAQEGPYYFKGYVTEVKEINTSNGNATFYIADKPGGSFTFYIYRVKGLNNENIKDSQYVKVGDEVTLCASITNYKGSTPETVQGKGYIYELKAATDNGGEEGEDTEDEESVVAGKGTQESPFNCSQAIAKCTEVGAEGSSEAYYIEGYVTRVKEVSTSFGNATFYIADKPAGKETFYVYRVKGLNNEKVSDENFIKEGDRVVVYAKVMNYTSDYGTTAETVQNSGYVYSVNGNTGK